MPPTTTDSSYKLRVVGDELARIDNVQVEHKVKIEHIEERVSTVEGDLKKINEWRHETTGKMYAIMSVITIFGGLAKDFLFKLLSK